MSDTYLTITAPSEGLYREKMSRFLAFALPVSSVDEARECIALYANEYHDARHVCWAYMVGADRLTYLSSDNGEPSGTAGKPILGQINSLGLTNVVVIVVRYFGGIKLGAGGLVRAYSQSVVECLDICDIVYTKKAPYYRLSFDYSLIRQIDYIFKTKAIDIYIKDYQEQVHYECFILNEDFIKELNHFITILLKNIN